MSVIAYAILKHHFLDIEVVIRKGVVYSALVAIVTGTYVVLPLLLGGLLQSITGHSNRIIVLLMALLITIGYRPIETFIQKITDKIFFREMVDYKKALRKLSHDVSFIIDLPMLLKVIVKEVAKAMRIESVSIDIKKPDNKIISSSFSFLTDELRMTKGAAGDLECLFDSDAAAPLVLAELEDMTREPKPDEIGAEKLMKVRDILRTRHIEIIVPLLGGGGLMGFLSLGRKLSEEPYAQEDIEFLLTFSNQAAMAIENAKLYQTVSDMKAHGENILENMAGGAIVVDNAGRITTFNRRAEEVTFLSSSSVIGKSFKNVFLEGSELSEVLSDALQGRILNEGREISVKKGQENVPLWVRTSVLKDASGAATGAIAIFDDLSKEKTMEEQLVRAERLATLGKFASGVVHEVRNPLVSIKTFFQYLNNEEESEEDKKELSQLASQEVIRIEQLLENLLSFAKPRQMEMSETHLSEILDEVLLLLRSEIEDNKIKTRIMNARGVLPILGDKKQLKQVFINLVRNAVEAMPGGGDLDIICGNCEVGEEVFVKISDMGTGIPKEVLPRLFEPFFSTKPNGTGMGLAVSYNIIENHKGYIDVESKAGEGATFTIILPVKQKVKSPRAI